MTLDETLRGTQEPYWYSWRKGFVTQAIETVRDYNQNCWLSSCKNVLLPTCYRADFPQYVAFVFGLWNSNFRFVRICFCCFIRFLHGVQLVHNICCLYYKCTAYYHLLCTWCGSQQIPFLESMVLTYLMHCAHLSLWLMRSYPWHGNIAQLHHDCKSKVF